MASPLPYAASFERAHSFSAGTLYPARELVQPVPAAPCKAAARAQRGVVQQKMCSGRPQWPLPAGPYYSSSQDAVISSLILL